MQLTHELDLIQSLQQLISSYMAKNPHLTLNALSQRANVPVTSLRRLHLGQQKNEIAPHSVLNLVSYIFREKNLRNLLTKVDRCVREFLQKHFGQFIFSSDEKAPDYEKEFNDSMKFFMLKVAEREDQEKLLELQRLQAEFATKVSQVLYVRSC